MQPLLMHEAENAVCIPVADDTAGIFRGHEVIGASLLARSYGQIVKPAAIREPTARIEEPCIFGGYAFQHFGHFLLETLARVWAIKKHPNRPVIWFGMHNLRAFRPWQLDVFRALGIHNQHHIILEPTALGSVLVPDPGFMPQQFFHPEHRDALAVIPWKDQGRKLWLSRSKLGDIKPMVENEAEIEPDLIADGWDIVHLETLAFREQLELLASASQVAGCIGSAFHNLMFIQGFGGRVDMFMTRKRLNPNFITIAETIGLRQHIHDVDITPLPSEKTLDRYAWTNVNQPLKALGIGRKSMNKPNPTHSSRRINAIARATGARSYLEIGVANGSTFLNVDIPRKIAVDPMFRFDTAPLQSGSVQFHQMTSDDYFTRQNEGPFDIIFLDGLHTAEQTFRDFCASQALAGPNTLWIIDDTVPSDIYSAWPHQNEAVKFRRMAGGQSNDWHGDVFKVVVMIRDYFPTLDFCTINTDGNPQTLVWRSATGRRPTGDGMSLEEISRMTFFDMLRHQEAFHMMSETDAIARATSALGGRRAYAA